MALTESSMLQLGFQAPDFDLPNIDGHTISRSHFLGRPLLIMFICNHCPYVKHVATELANIGTDYLNKEIGIVSIQSNDVDAYPDDSAEKMKEESEHRGYSFPYLLDSDQSVAKAYTATCTPDFFLFDANHKLAYRGRLDETRPTRITSGVYDSKGNEANGRELRAAMDAVLSGNSPALEQWPSMGCNIKWKPEKTA